MKLEKIHFEGTISEMQNKVDAFQINVPFASGVNVEELVEGDDNPLFVTVEALNPQISGNRRRWTEEALYQVAEQVNSLRPDAYQGHIKEDDRNSASPESQTIWLGAIVQEIAGKKRLFIKGYVLPYASKWRQYLQKAKAVGKRVAVSVYGKAYQIWNNTMKAYDISNFNLESIDWARSGSEGVKGMGYLQLTSEMSKGKQIMERTEILQSVTIGEMKEINPSIVEELKKETVSEMEETNNKEKADLNSKLESANVVVGEMNELRKTLKVAKDKKVSDVISEMSARNSELESKLADNLINSEIAKKAKGENARGIIKKLVISEMSKVDVTEDDTKRQRYGGFSNSEIKAKKSLDAVLSGPEAKSVIKEMTGSTDINPNIDNRVPGEVRKFTSL